MVRDELPEELDDQLPAEKDVDVIEGDVVVEPPAEVSEPEMGGLPTVEAIELDHDSPAVAAEAVLAEPPSSELPSGITLGEALSLGMGQVPERRLPDLAGPTSLPPMPSVHIESETPISSIERSPVPAAVEMPELGKGAQERFYSYYEMQDRYFSGEAQPSTDPRSIFYGMPPRQRGQSRRLRIEVEVTVTNAERIATIAVEKSKHELEQLLNSHMLEISDKFYAVRQMIRQLSRG